MKKKILWIWALLLTFSVSIDARWKNGSIYRDPQLEYMLLKFLSPLYKAAGLNADLI